MRNVQRRAVSLDVKRKYLDDVGKELQVKNLDDWYKLSSSDVIQKGGKWILREYGGSLIQTLRSVYPEYKWLPWNFNSHVPKRFWTDSHNQREFFDWLGVTLKVKKIEDWYKVTSRKLRENGAHRLMQQYYGGSLYRTLSFIYPEQSWDKWKFQDEVHDWKDRGLQREFFDYVSRRLEHRSSDDWYGVSISQVKEMGGEKLMRQFDDNLYNALSTIYPMHPWKIWKFRGVPSGFWNDFQNRRKFFDSVALNLNLKTYEDWYNVDATTVRDDGGGGLLAHHYSGSLMKALLDVYPEHPWQMWKFSQVPRGFWEDINNQRNYFDYIGVQLGVKKMEDWYQVDSSQVRGIGATALLGSQYSGSLIRALLALYPEFPWQFWKFKYLSQSYWESTENQKLFLDWFAKEHNVKEQRDWYKVTETSIVDNGGKGLLNQYEGSLSKALSKIYPNQSWEKWKFSVDVPATILSRHQQLFDEFANQHDIKKFEDWYGVRVAVIKERAPTLHQVIQQYYSGSLVKALISNYQQFPWQVWRFNHPPKGFWSNRDSIKSYLDWLAETFGVTSLDDWYQVSSDFARKFRGNGLVKRRGGLFQALREFYPEHSWKKERILSPNKSQMLIVRRLRELFPLLDIQINYRNPELFFSSSARMENDIFMPSLSIIFEYQGLQHYQYHFKNGLPTSIQTRDAEKRKACSITGITLIEIPHWWDQTTESLAATIHKYRPDVIAKPFGAVPIPETPSHSEDTTELVEQENLCLASHEMTNNNSSMQADFWLDQ